MANASMFKGTLEISAESKLLALKAATLIFAALPKEGDDMPYGVFVKKYALREASEGQSEWNLTDNDNGDFPDMPFGVCFPVEGSGKWSMTNTFRFVGDWLKDRLPQHDVRELKKISFAIRLSGADIEPGEGHCEVLDASFIHVKGNAVSADVAAGNTYYCDTDPVPYTPEEVGYAFGVDCSEAKKLMNLD